MLHPEPPTAHWEVGGRSGTLGFTERKGWEKKGRTEGDGGK